MRPTLRIAMAGLALTGIAHGMAQAQSTHVVRLIANAKTETYRFEPADIVAKPGDALVFHVVSGAPHSVIFEGQGLSPGIRGAFNSSMPDRSGDLSSPLLTTSGKEYRMVVPQVHGATYQFYCLPHRAYDMRGTLTIQ
jgi:plastocyanin